MYLSLLVLGSVNPPYARWVPPPVAHRMSGATGPLRRRNAAMTDKHPPMIRPPASMPSTTQLAQATGQGA